jgi:hypothetical protein
VTGEPAALLEVLPRADRRRLRVLCGSLHMLEQQVRAFPVGLAERIGLPDAEAFHAWHQTAVLIHAGTIDGP